VKRLPLYVLALSTLAATAAQAQTLSFVLVPTITPGVTAVKVEMLRSDLTLVDVQVTYVGDGQSAIDKSATTLKAYVGPSTSRPNPLLDLTPVVPSGGMVMLSPVAGLSPVEVSFEVEESPSRTAWKLPLLAESDFFPANSTIYVLNLVKAADAASNLQLFNIGQLAATCSVKVLRPKGSVVDERDGITVPAVGVTGISDILRKVSTIASGINAAVTCDQPFYALGAYPATNRWNSAVEYPVTELPGAQTAVTLYSSPGRFFHATQGNGLMEFPLNLDPNTAYRTMTMSFDADIALPRGQVFFEALLGFSRKGGRRFGKTLFFGNFYKYSENKMVIDEGSPFIETDVKRTFPLVQGHTYHWTVTCDNTLQSTHYVITNEDGTNVTDIYTGLYNNFNVVNGNLPTIDLGLGGVADNAYFPPVGWTFSNLSIVVTH